MLRVIPFILARTLGIYWLWLTSILKNMMIGNQSNILICNYHLILFNSSDRIKNMDYFSRRDRPPHPRTRIRGESITLGPCVRPCHSWDSWRFFPAFPRLVSSSRWLLIGRPKGQERLTAGDDRVCSPYIKSSG